MHCKREVFWIAKLSEKRFCEAYMEFYNGKMSINKASEYLGISRPTTTKYFSMVLLGQPLPKDLFKKKFKKKSRKNP
ncbi:hypothetical protein DWZ16_11120 [Clostridium sp. AF29-8BH]|nr:hypothetical protein DWZ16_11120 [Clostridium sp. AF29-8BH]